jgi:hypothetical protein
MMLIYLFTFKFTLNYLKYNLISFDEDILHFASFLDNDSYE